MWWFVPCFSLRRKNTTVMTNNHVGVCRFIEHLVGWTCLDKIKQAIAREMEWTQNWNHVKMDTSRYILRAFGLWYFNGLARKDANIAAKNLVRLEMTRPSVPSTHWKMKWGIKESSFQCFRLIGFMRFFLRIKCSYRSFLKCSGFSFFFFNYVGKS